MINVLLGKALFKLYATKYCIIFSADENKMKPTNPNAHTYVTDTEVQRHFAWQGFSFQCKVVNAKCKV